MTFSIYAFSDLRADTLTDLRSGLAAGAGTPISCRRSACRLRLVGS